uniref:Uncharacterized protein n=1 Tax=Phytophthora ramorum TaxID=164328 RepID=H3GQT8_PHYRM
MDRFGFYLALSEGKKDGTFYLRIFRVKTSEEQGPTLIPDKDDFMTCPLHTLAVALATKNAPCAALLDHLPEPVLEDVMSLDSGASLHDLLSAKLASLQVSLVPGAASLLVSFDPSCLSATAVFTPPTSTETQTTTIATQKKTAKQGTDSVQAYVNRMLKRITRPAGAAADLTLHAFRRGGAQHTNRDDHLAAQWIF